MEPIPSKSINNVVLTSLLVSGGTSVPSAVYAAVGSVYPSLARDKDLDYKVRWCRANLAARGLVSSKIRGEWSLTPKGRRAARALVSSIA